MSEAIRAALAAAQSAIERLGHNFTLAIGQKPVRDAAETLAEAAAALNRIRAALATPAEPVAQGKGAEPVARDVELANLRQRVKRQRAELRHLNNRARCLWAGWYAAHLARSKPPKEPHP